MVSNLASDFCQHAILEVWNLWVSLLKSQNDFFAEGKRLSETQRMQRRNFRISYQVVLKIETVYANTSQNTHTQWLFYPTHSNICCALPNFEFSDARATSATSLRTFTVELRAYLKRAGKLLMLNSKPRAKMWFVEKIPEENTQFWKKYFLRCSDARATSIRTFNVELRAHQGTLANIWCEIRNHEQKRGL